MTTRTLTTRSLTTTVVAALVTGALACALVALAPWPLKLREHSAGDPSLAEALRTTLGTTGYDRVAVAYVPPGGTEALTAGFGADSDSVFEAGSISKAVTGMLFAESIERGEVTPGTTLDDVFGDRAGASADVTLEQLATHSSGLPRLVRGDLGQTVESTVRGLARLDPYVLDTEELIAAAAGTTPDPTQPPTYSNFGFGLLGAALVEVTGTSYPKLVDERIVQPLDLQDTYVPADTAAIRDGDVRGRGTNGLPAGAWTLKAQAPAGAVRSSVRDLAVLAQAVQNGTAPGADAAHARTDYRQGSRIGWGWITDEHLGGDPDSGPVTWHNGGTGGFRSIVGFTPEGAVIAVLANTEKPVDEALTLLDPEVFAAAAGADSGAASGAADPDTTDPATTRGGESDGEGA